MYICESMVYAQLLMGLGALVYSSEMNMYTTVSRYGMNTAEGTMPAQNPAIPRKK